jgi:superfamily I DNA/RNA helicase
MQPTKQQENILEFHEDMAIIAAPGSGKTYVISEKIRQILTACLPHKGVVAISYTNKASLELKDRCLKNGMQPKSSFFGTMDKFYISEIVIPFGQHIWGVPDNDFSVPLISDLSEEDQHQLLWLIRDLTSDKLSDVHIKILGDFFKKGIIPLEGVGLLSNYIFERSLACRKYMKALYVAIYIDEYQDCGANQHALFLKIKAMGITAVAVGDLNQSIYAFSGKSAIYLQELTGNPAFKTFPLDKNHRCHQSIINYSNYLLNPNVQLAEVDQKRVFLARVAGAEPAIAAFIDGKAENLNKQNVKNAQIAILVRNKRTMELIDQNLKTAHRVVQSTDLDLNLNLWSGIFANLLRFAFDKTYRFLEVIEEHVDISRLAREQRIRLLQLRKELPVCFQAEVFDLAGTLQKFVEIAEIIAPKAKSREPVKLLTEVLNLKSLWEAYKPGGDHQINIMTLHKAKGLEFEVIFHLDLYDSILPKKAPDANGKWVHDNYQQDLNLHYVGVTRAKQACVLLLGTQRTKANGQLTDSKDSEFLWLNNIKDLR